MGCCIFRYITTEIKYFKLAERSEQKEKFGNSFFWSFKWLKIPSLCLFWFYFFGFVFIFFVFLNQTSYLLSAFFRMCWVCVLRCNCILWNLSTVSTFFLIRKWRRKEKKNWNELKENKITQEKKNPFLANKNYDAILFSVFFFLVLLFFLSWKYITLH